MESVTQQLRARELAKVGSLQRYATRIITEILTPAQVCWAAWIKAESVTACLVYCEQSMQRLVSVATG